MVCEHLQTPQATFRDPAFALQFPQRTKYYLRVLRSFRPRRYQVPLLPERPKALLRVGDLRRQVVDNLVLLARLARGNGPDQYTEDRLRDHIRN